MTTEPPRVGERHFSANHRRIVVDKREHLFTGEMSGWSWRESDDGTTTSTEWSAEVDDAMRRRVISLSNALSEPVLARS
jgi:hypothetical protein